MIWRNPVAWLGLATLLIPLAIHLLVRHRAEPRPFPSLRFVQPTRLAAVRRKMISDWPLLVIRLAILAFAVAALADPLWQSAARRAQWNDRQARAIVVDTTPSVSGADAVDAVRSFVEREEAGAFKAEALKATDLADGIRRATDWLRTAPPARRELIVISDFQLGALDARAFRDVPAHVGIRLARTPGTPATRTVDGHPRAQRTVASAGGFTTRSPRVTINSNETAVSWIDASSSVEIDATSSTTSATTSGDEVVTRSKDRNEASDTPGDITLRPLDVTLRGSAADRPFLLAAAEAVLVQGVPVAAGSAGARNAATIIIASESPGVAAPGANAAGTLTAPWQSDVARAIATDTSLSRAVGRVASGVGTLSRSASATLDKPGATSSTDSTPIASATRSPTAATAASENATAAGSTREFNEAAAKLRRASNNSGEAPAARSAETPAPTEDATAAASTRESNEAAAKLRRASNDSGEAPAPWVVLMRDADGAPAILAAAEGARADARMLVWSRVAAGDETTALLIRATLRALAGADAFDEAEVLAIPDATLAQWQRPSSEPPVSEWSGVDRSDRRWLWSAVLVLLVAEQILRRRRRHREAQPDRPDGKVLDHAA